MQASHLFLENSLSNHKNIINSFVRSSQVPQKTNVTLVRSSSQPLQSAYANAINCIGLISDPLWKKVCMEVLNRMGAVSVLKIWESELGESQLQGKEFDVMCETVESAEFIQQYDFVVISILQQYFPSLKKLNIQTRAVA